MKLISSNVFDSCSDNRKSNPVSLSKDPKSKWAGFSLSFSHSRWWGCAHGAAAEESPSDRISKSCAPFPANVARVEAFRQGLRELGYVEGKNIVIECAICGRKTRTGCLNWWPSPAPQGRHYRYERHRPTRAAKEATTTIPIVMTHDTDPVGSGFIASLARPGGNITGLSALAPELNGKRLELLKEIVPKLSRVAVLGNSSEPAIKEVK